MELMDGEQKKKEGTGKKIIAMSIVVLIIVLVILLSVIVAINQSIDEAPKINVDGKKYKMPSGLMITQNETTYVSISYLASYTGYKSYNGEYKEYTEDTSKGYVECENEIASFAADSNIIYKNNAKDKTNFDAQTIKLPIISYNNMLYASLEDIGIIFNSQVFFKKSDNTLVVHTTPYLISYYKTQIEKYGYDGVSEEFNTQKAVAHNMLVVKKDDKYGVVSTEDFTKIIGTRYEKMVFVESTQEFIVTSDGKTGLISADGENKIGLRYDDIGLIDTEYKLYYAKNDDLIGVLNGNGKVIVYLEYNSLGIERESFPYDSIKHNMLLYENCIPIMKYEARQSVDKDGKSITIQIKKWGLADKIGNILLNTEYDSIGYVETNTGDKSINNVVIIPKIKGIVIGKDGKYGVVDSIGKMIIPCEYDKIYSITNEGKDEFYLEQEGKTIKLDRYIADNKIQVYEEKENTSNSGNTVDTPTNGLTDGNTVNTNTVVDNTISNTVDNTNTTNETNTNTENNVDTPEDSGELVVVPIQ